MHLRAASALLTAAVLASGCTSTDSVLNLASPEPAAPVAAEATDTADGQGTTSPALQSTQNRETTAVAALSTNAQVQVAPVIGAPAESVPPLSQRLSARAAERGITLMTNGNGGSLVMKGYFSAIADGNATTVIYVWDVLDSSGSRLHRIQGQQKSSGGSGDGWSSVTPATMQAIADQTIDQLAAWLSSRRT